MKKGYDKTIRACFFGYIIQAIINNFVPLLFLTFKSSYGIPLSDITLLVTFNFGIQLIIDLISALFVDKIGYRASMMIAHAFSAAGLVMLTFLPDLMSNHFIGILIPVMVYAVGGGLLEVLVSPVVESCPSDNKEKTMSMLHSFYCWGHVGVVLVSTVFFAVFGIENWRILAGMWALVPVWNMFSFATVPLAPVVENGEKGCGFAELLKNRYFLILFVMMVCAGASEQAVSQWASLFAENGLGVTKTIGDLAGPMCFAIMMGISRSFYGKYGDRIDLDVFMSASCLMCMATYLCIALIPNPIIGLAGCAMTGLAVGIMWPGTFSKAASSIKRGGTVMFALLALGGDIGCSAGPTLAGFVSDTMGGNLRMGILAAVIFPVFLLVGIFLCRKQKS